MTYAIGHIVYGIDLTYEREWAENLPQDLKDAFEDEPTSLGFENSYSGNGEMPLWLGVLLDEFDECNNYRITKITKWANPSEETKQKWEKAVAALEPEVYKALLASFGEEPQSPDGSGGLTLRPEMLIIWGSS